MKNLECQACAWVGDTDHACPQCGGQDWTPASLLQEAAAPASAPKSPVSPSPAKPSRR